MVYRSKLSLENQNHLWLKKRLHHGQRQHYQLFFPVILQKASSMQTNLGYFINVCQTRSYILRKKNAQGGIIAKFASPAEKARSFKGVKDLPCRYRAERKSWMSAELSEDWLKELDQKFGSSKRKIALITVQPICTWKILSGLNWYFYPITPRHIPNRWTKVRFKL